MKPEDAEEFTQSLGQIVAGSYRQIVLAKNLGVPKALGLTVEQWVQTRLGGYVRLSIEERREAVKELTEEGMSQRAVAEVLGVNQKTIGRDLTEANASKKAGSNGKGETNVSASKPKISSPSYSLTENGRDQAKVLEQARKQELLIRAEHLFLILGTLGLGKESPAQRAVDILDYDERFMKTTQLEITNQLWDEALTTLKECQKQWNTKHVSTRRTTPRTSNKVHRH